VPGAKSSAGLPNDQGRPAAGTAVSAILLHKACKYRSHTDGNTDARTVLSQLTNRFEDYNEVHPHKALCLKWSREFIRSYLQPAACPVG
jgi:hypothetical protein